MPGRLLPRSVALLLSTCLLPTESAIPQQVLRTGPPPVRVSGDCAMVPMRLIEHVPVVEIMIGDRGPFRFAIDTGASSHGRISPTLARDLGLAVIGEARAAAPGGSVSLRPIYAAPSLSLGSLRFQGVELVEGSAVRGPEAGWDGILGLDLFRELMLVIDYGNSIAGARRVDLAEGVPASFDQRIAVIPVEIGGRTFTVDLDTGNGAGGLFLREADARSLPLAGEPVARGHARTSFGEFAIMEAPLAAPVTVGGQRLTLATVGWPPARGNGNLGSRALTGSVLRLDRRSGRVAITPSGTPPSCS